MKKIFTKVVLAFFGLCCSFGFSLAQSTTISGNVIDESYNDPLAGVNIVVKGKVVGTISDPDGNFSLTVDQAPPLTLVFSFIGFETQEIEITNATTADLQIGMAEQSLLGQEIVVSASRVEESILESPVSVEKMDIRAIRESAAPSFYDNIRTLKGIDVSTQSLTFTSINPRGFGANGNTRTVQQIDGIDNQAPGLNFPVGNIVGISDVDLESVEILPGAASALYGPNAIQGIILMKSKSPFDYQGLTVSAQVGVNHVDEEDDDMSIYNNYQLRYAKAFNNNGQANIDVHLSDGSCFNIDRWATQQGGFSSSQKWLVGDFNGDGRDDLAKSFATNNQATIDVHLSENSRFVLGRGANQQAGFWDAQQWLAGDFNGDGRDDLGKAFNSSGQANLDVHLII